jgi:tRNA(adenine34) deaminase
LSEKRISIILNRHPEHQRFMHEAIQEALKADAIGDVPVGAVIVHEGRIISRGRNRREEWRDPTAHAEMLAIREAAEVLGGWRLSGTTVYCTMEPCPMCAGALVQARVPRLIYGVDDPKAGAAGSVFDLVRSERLNHRIEVISGVLAGEIEEILQDFFLGLRDRRGR